jgi:hypothetical protein
VDPSHAGAAKPQFDLRDEEDEARLLAECFANEGAS